MRPSWETSERRLDRSIASFDDGYYSQKEIENIVEEIKDDSAAGEWRFSARIHKNSYSYTINNDNKVDSFRIENKGFNKIITNSKLHKSASRSFDFKFADRKRQDMYLHITDIVDEKLDEKTERLIYFFPRTYFPAIEAIDNDIRVILPTGEKVYFDSTKKILQAGPMSEEHVDYNLNPLKKASPQISYSGFGLTITLDKRLGKDPRVENIAAIKHPDVKEKCLLASNQLFEQTGRFEFKFHSDLEFENYLKDYCDFGLPKPGVFIP